MKGAAIVTTERIAAKIFVVRAESVMFDSDLATLYGVESRGACWFRP